MPEIAEVETVRNTLKNMILNKEIKGVNVLYPKMIDSNLEEFKSILPGKKFIDIKRNGKWLIFDLGDYYLLSHLRMEGKYFVKNHDEEINKHEHVIITFTDNTDLRYHDTRKFGRMKLIKKEELDSTPEIKKQGIEPISDKLTKEYLYDKIHSKQIPVKTILLDQTIISGLGNIYADEVLFASHINPLKKGSDITINDCENIKNASRDIISKAIEHGGTTIKSYTSSLGVTGRFQQFLMVHKREGEPCLVCKTQVVRIKVGGRSTYYCPKCQKM